MVNKNLQSSFDKNLEEKGVSEQLNLWFHQTDICEWTSTLPLRFGRTFPEVLKERNDYSAQ